MSVGNLLRDLPDDTGEEHFEEIVAGPGSRVERIVSRGQASPAGFWYEQERGEWVAVLSGAARLRLEDPAEIVELRPGDHCWIAARRRHRVEWTDEKEPTVWLAVHLDDAGAGGGHPGMRAWACWT